MANTLPPGTSPYYAAWLGAVQGTKNVWGVVTSPIQSAKAAVGSAIGFSANTGFVVIGGVAVIMSMWWALKPTNDE